MTWHATGLDDDLAEHGVDRHRCAIGDVERAGRADDGRDAELARQHRGVRQRPAVARHDRAGDRQHGVEGGRRRPHDEHVARLELLDRLVGRGRGASRAGVRRVADADPGQRIGVRARRRPPSSPGGRAPSAPTPTISASGPGSTSIGGTGSTGPRPPGGVTAPSPAARSARPATCAARLRSVGERIASLGGLEQQARARLPAGGPPPPAGVRPRAAPGAASPSGSSTVTGPLSSRMSITPRASDSNMSKRSCSATGTLARSEAATATWSVGRRVSSPSAGRPARARAARAA